MSFKEMQSAVMAELAAAVQDNSKLLEAEQDLIKTQSSRTQARTDTYTRV